MKRTFARTQARARNDHRQHQIPSQRHLERILERRHFQPMEVIEQMTYLLFIKRLDELQTVKEKQANRLKREVEINERAAA